ncbi:MAG: sensor domain-containing diguanylate cyclase [Acholeplasmataceae bacterium]|jgi:diguanylate cyclase (GGDEF)-like protein/PAS domain S-box-containing protein|nr:sensor domain-containing diguanylate cyclase [Acholeplasmataceae bacterium]
MNQFDQNLVSHLFEGVYVVDNKRMIIFWNEGSERITGYSAEEVVNKYCFNNLLQHVDQSGKQLCFGGCPLHHTLQTGEMQQNHVFLKHKDGYRVPVSVKSLPIYDDQKQVVGAIEIFTDERFQRNVFLENETLKDELMKDPLTQIANRRYFEFSLNQVVNQFKTFNKKFGVLLFDIDHFKTINDDYGHLIGDEMLKIVAKSLVSNIQKSDLISRWGGEEFIGLFDVESENDLFSIADRLRIIVSKSSYKLSDNKDLQVTISIGGAIIKDGILPKNLIDKADQGLYQSKKNGRNQVTIIQ